MFMDKKAFLEKYPQFSPGMHVCDKENQPLGRIVSVSDNSITIEKGVFFPKDFTLRYDDVEDIKGDTIYVRKYLAELGEWKDETYKGWERVEDINVGKMQAVPTEEYRQKFESLPEETVVPIFEEELEAKKVRRQKGEVRVRKIVHTELKHMTVPVDHEEVSIERVQVARRDLSQAEAGAAFKESTVNVPVMDEEVEIGKHAVMKGEVHVKKGHNVEQREVTGEVRSEDVEIQGAEKDFGEKEVKKEEFKREELKRKAG